MENLYKVQDLVEKVLRENEETRADDFLLVLEVYECLMPSIDDPLFPIGFYEVMAYHNKFKLPSFHTITRCRRKLQALYPELKIKEVEVERVNKTKDYIEYALDK